MQSLLLSFIFQCSDFRVWSAAVCRCVVSTFIMRTGWRVARTWVGLCMPLIVNQVKLIVPCVFVLQRWTSSTFKISGIFSKNASGPSAQRCAASNTAWGRRPPSSDTSLTASDSQQDESLWSVDFHWLSTSFKQFIKKSQSYLEKCFFGSPNQTLYIIK